MKICLLNEIASNLLMKKPPVSAAAMQNGTGNRAVFIEIFCSDRQRRFAVIL